MSARFGPVTSLTGEFVAPPDKSISHRAALFAAMAQDYAERVRRAARSTSATPAR
jgi:5-enolpyruvylshikimate-3-phosphate synthase